MLINDMRGDQARQMIDAEQVYAAYRETRSDLERRSSGSMSWKTVRGRDYLYRKHRDVSKSLGPRSEETERAHRQFHENRERDRDRLASLASRLDAMAPVNRALQLGRVPLIAARILRALGDAHLSETALCVVGTNALFAYERMTGVQIESGYLATVDVDLLFDARSSLKLLAPDVASAGIMGLLNKLDRSFRVVGRQGFRAQNHDGYLVDLIMPAAKDPLVSSPRSRIGSDATDLQAVEIEGLSWLVNSPKATCVVIDEKGYPLEMRVPDPRAFALHKSWLAERPDRDPLKRGRDRAQAELVATLLSTRLPHLAFDDAVLSALPIALRERAATLAAPSSGDAASPKRLVPNW